MTTVTDKQSDVKSLPELKRGHPRKSKCGLWTGFRALDNDDVVFGRLLCKSWNCGKCRPMKFSKLLTKLRDVDICQHVLLTFPHPYTVVRRDLPNWLQVLRRDNAGLKYHMIVWSKSQRTEIGIFLADRIIPKKWFESSWAFYGIEAKAATHTIYDVDTRVRWMTVQFAVWANESTHIHRVTHSRNFFAGSPPVPREDGEKFTFVSEAPVGYWLERCSELGLPVTKLNEDLFLISHTVIRDRGVTPLKILFPDGVPRCKNSK